MTHASAALDPGDRTRSPRGRCARPRRAPDRVATAAARRARRCVPARAPQTVACRICARRFSTGTASDGRRVTLWPRAHDLHERREARRAEALLARAGSLAHRQRLIAQAMAVVEQQHLLVAEDVRRAPGPSCSHQRMRRRRQPGRTDPTSRPRDRDRRRRLRARGARRRASPRAKPSTSVGRARFGPEHGEVGKRAASAGMISGSRYGATVGITPSRSVPSSGLARAAREIEEIVRGEQDRARLGDDRLGRRRHADADDGRARTACSPSCARPARSGR